MKPKPTPSITRSFGSTETHRVTVIELKPEHRATLQQIAKSLPGQILNPILGRVLSRRGSQGKGTSLFPVYEK
jgi:hypothetical protein